MIERPRELSGETLETCHLGIHSALSCQKVWFRVESTRQGRRERAAQTQDLAGSVRSRVFTRYRRQTGKILPVYARASPLRIDVSRELQSLLLEEVVNAPMAWPFVGTSASCNDIPTIAGQT